MDSRVIGGTLRRSRLLERFSSEDLGKLAQLVEPKTFEPGQEIYGFGDEGDGFFFLAAGKVEFFIPSRTGVLILSTLEPVDSFGELSVLLPGPRMAGARAVDDVMVFEFNQGTFKMLGVSDPSLAFDLVEAIRKRVGESFRALRPLLGRVIVEVAAKSELPQRLSRD